MDANQVWNLVDLPDGARSIECKWVFKRKTDQDENLSVYKAMLKSVRIMLALAAYFDWEYGRWMSKRLS